MGIFDPRKAFKPYEYPDVVAYKEAVQHSFWLVGEWNFISDLNDFRTKLNPAERSAIKNALLAISQIEVSVKRFWAKIGERFPKAEIEQVGIVFADSEVRHSDAYSHLLHVLGLNDEFDQLLDNPVIQGRVDYLTKYLKGAADNSNQAYTLTLTLFSIFIENVSLFSQFLVIKSFWKMRGLLKDVYNVVQATQKEELVHALFGVRLLGHIQAENPDWFNDDFYQKIGRACRKAYDAEIKIIDWIYSGGDLPFLPAATVKEFAKARFNESLRLIGAAPAFEPDLAAVASVKWFDEDVYGSINPDFFHMKPVTYSKKTRSITAGDLF